MVRANSAKVEFNTGKKRWEVHISVGAEVVKRPIAKPVGESGKEVLRQEAVQTAKDEGYDLDPANVAVEESEGHLA